MSSLDDYLLDLAVRHSHYLHRYASGLADLIFNVLDAEQRSIVRLLADLPDDLSEMTRARLERLLSAIREVNAKAYDRLGDVLQSEMRGLAVYEAGFVARGLTAARLDFTMPAPQQLHAATTSRPFQGKLLREWVEDLSDQSFKRLRGAVRMAVIEGRTVGELTRTIRGSKDMNYRDGLMNVDRRQAEAVARTAVAHVNNAARQLVYEQNKKLVTGVKWVSTLDARTTPLCQSLDGKVFPLDSGPRPPAHINCRSTTIPVMPSLRDMGVDLDIPEGWRASKDGPVPANLTYNDWLRRQDAEFQDSVLGPARGKLFRQGGYTLDRFVDDLGHRYTLAQLREMDGKTFRRLKI